MPALTIPEGIILRILEDETSAIRFEQFCCDLLTEVDGANYLGTSRSWDLGRDGRSLPVGNGMGIRYILCTTGKEVEAKAFADLDRMLQFALPEAVYFCTSKSESEHTLQTVENRMRSIAGSVKCVVALGAHQLAPLVQRHPTIFQRRYAAELLEHRDFISGPIYAPGPDDMLGLQIALATQFDSSAQGLRERLIRTLALKSLSSAAKLSISGVAKHASEMLHLPRLIHPEYFRGVLNMLVEEGLLLQEDGLFALTQDGREILASGDATRANCLDRGKYAIQEALGRLLGSPLDESSFDQLWTQLLEEFAAIFFARGLKIVQTIGSLTQNAPPIVIRQTFAELLKGMRSRIVGLGIGGARSEAVGQAVVDLFAERNSDALTWLTEIAVKYVSFCSLGLEPTAQQEITGQLKDITLVLDTDIVLSFLSEGERPHKAIEETINRWKEIGGGNAILPAVLHEAAYHAWISDFEYKDKWRDLESLTPNAMPHEIVNAFVRAFYFAAKGRYSPSRWNRFISEYRGSDRDDTSVMREILIAKGFHMVDEIDVDSDFADTVRSVIYEIRKLKPDNHIPKNTADKAWRDSQILAYLKMLRSSQQPPRSTTVIVSSSPILQEAAERLSDQFGEPGAVWPCGALAYLVSLVPGTRLTLDVLRNCLFDESEYDSTDEITRFAMRVIRQSDQYSIGYSQRPTLQRELDRQIAKGACERGQKASDFKLDLLEQRDRHRDDLARIIAGAIDEIETSKSERKLQKLEQRVKDLTNRKK